MCEILTLGEPMALFIANQEGPLDQINQFTKLVAGAELNVAVGMARLEHKVAYITKLGADPFGKYIQNFLTENDIDASYVKFDEQNPTGFQLKSKVSAGDPEVVYFRKNSAASKMNLQDIRDIDWGKVKHLHVTGIPPALSQSCRDLSYELIALARKQGATVSFDPNLRPNLWSSRQEMIEVINDLASRADWVLPGINEGKILTGSDDVQVIADFYLKAGVQAVIIKLGEKGAFVKTSSLSLPLPGYKVAKVVDTVGAGDGFAVGVISALLEGQSLTDAVKRGNAIGALAVMSPGDNDGLPTRAQLQQFMEEC